MGGAILVGSLLGRVWWIWRLLLRASWKCSVEVVLLLLLLLLLLLGSSLLSRSSHRCISVVSLLLLVL
jgi:hypothetical protein